MFVLFVKPSLESAQLNGVVEYTDFISAEV